MASGAMSIAAVLLREWLDSRSKSCVLSAAIERGEEISLVRRARVQNTSNICMQAMRIRCLWLDGDPLTIDMLDVYVLLRVGREPELSNISAHPVYVVHGKNQIKIIFGSVAGLAKLDANIRATGADSPKGQRMPNDWPVG